LAQVLSTQLAIKRFKLPPHPLSASALPLEIRSSKIPVKMNERTLLNSVYPGQSITRLDCRVATCQADDVQKCLWLQKATVEVWISLEHNIADTVVNEWRNRLRVCD